MNKETIDLDIGERKFLNSISVSRFSISKEPCCNELAACNSL